ncbi:unnamed protein product [Soboliphyme baturini]|uniref:Importin N-terminal domain-containing protein n=1 Tax=Soboliphyme baturini TaxID=241478 RepID=A0A183INC4_9BILA|nr:unnamed protein product [Soboliphyme baturini]
MGTLITEQASKLLDFSQEQLDVPLLDSVVSTMYHGSGQQQRTAEEILNQLKEHPDSWTRVDAILQYSNNSQTKYYALQILETLIKTRWKTLTRDQCEGIKNYVVSLVIDLSSQPRSLDDNDRLYLNKLNIVLVQIVKREWPMNWPNFITEIVGASRSNEALCQNNMNILKLLSEEVFDFSTGQMTQAQANHRKQQFCGDFQAVFQLCQYILESSPNVQLVLSTLTTLLRFLNWIPVGYIFETNLIEMLTTKFLTLRVFQNVSLKCLTEIASVSASSTVPQTYEERMLQMFLATMEQLKKILPPDLNICAAYRVGNDVEQKFIANLAIFLSTFLKEHGKLVEVLPDSTVTEDSVTGKIAKAHNVYWNWLAAELYRESPFLANYSMGVAVGGFGITAADIPLRIKLYNDHLTSLRYIIIGRMAKPEEVLVIQNDQGEVVRETIKDTDAINLYKTMRETLVYLTHLGYVDTERIMTEKLQNQVNGTEWSWKNLNTLCWAIGSISGALMEEDEKQFLVMVIRDLLGLCEQKRGKDNKAVIASNIMYVVGQYPRFLRAHWKFLKTVVNKLFEFMHETHEGVQDMACETFIKIAHKCRKHFVIIQACENQPFIEEILLNLSSVICDLSPPQVHIFYEAMGYLVSAQQDAEIQKHLLEELMSLPNTLWDQIVAHASQDMEVLQQADIVRNLVNILKTNVAACKSIGNPFSNQLIRIYLDMLNVYTATSSNINGAISLHGEDIVSQPLIKYMRGVKTEILRLISTWVAKAENVELVYRHFVPPLFEAVLLDYQSNVPPAREPEVLSTITTIINKLEKLITPEIPRIFDAIFECTLNMINKDFQEFPEHRTNFFLFLQAVNECCFQAFLNIPPAQFKLIIDSIIWGFKHSMRNVAESGLLILLKLLDNMVNKTDPETAQNFYRVYFLDLLQHVFTVVTDSSQAQVAGLSYFASILSYMFRMVEAGTVVVFLGDPSASNKNNIDFLFHYVCNFLKTAFPHLTELVLRLFLKFIILCQICIDLRDSNPHSFFLSKADLVSLGCLIPFV